MYLLNFSLTIFCIIWFYLVLFLLVFVVELLVLSMFVEAVPQQWDYLYGPCDNICTSDYKFGNANF
jgi:hypothetical protein